MSTRPLPELHTLVPAYSKAASRLPPKIAFPKVDFAPSCFAAVGNLALRISRSGDTILGCAKDDGWQNGPPPQSPEKVEMVNSLVTREDYLQDAQGRTFADVINDPAQPFDNVLEFFADADRQRRMEESELHHDRSPLAGVVRELESQPAINQFLASAQTRRNARFRQAIGVLVRMIMERRAWQKTGRKGSLGVRAPGAARTPAHNTGGLAFWFVRAERYERTEGMPFRSVRERCQELESVPPRPSGSETKARPT